MVTDLLNAFLWIFNFLVLPAVTYGSALALGALGVTLVFGILRFANFAHGDMMAFGAMVTLIGVELLNRYGIFTYPVPAGLLLLPVAMAMTGLLAISLDKFVFSYYRRIKSPPVVVVMASIGVMFLLNGITRLIKGVGLTPFNARRTFDVGEVDVAALADQLGEKAVAVKSDFATQEKFVQVSEPELVFFDVAEFKAATGLAEGFGLDLIQVLTVVLAVAVFLGLYWFLSRTRTGKAMRAFSDNEDLARLSGIDPQRVVTVTWLIAGSLAAIAGTMYGMDKGYKPFTYFQMLLPIFAATIVGGIGHPQGAILGGYLVAFTEVVITANYKKVVNYLVPESWEMAGNLQLLGTEYKFGVSFLILVVVLLFRPTGIFKGRVL
ncbi:MAG: branched-chain amino acid ABC transporter permease [Rhodospirillales bacterium]|nr:branched-chain amino acid ABC transporter permease [Rhodospirillales bacterium]